MSRFLIRPGVSCNNLASRVLGMAIREFPGDFVGNACAWGSHLDRLSENAKFKKSGIDIKGLMTRILAKIPILGQPVD